MAERSGVAWLQRLWRRSVEETAALPGTPALLPVEQALAALEAQLCEGIVRRGGEPRGAALAARIELPGARPRNVFGRPVQEESAVGAAESVAVAAGMVLTGLRASVFLGGEELVSSHEALRNCAERLAPLLVHASCGSAGHGGYHAVANSGAFQVLASSGQEALDLSLVSHWVAERALLPGLICTDVEAVESLHLPDAETIRSYLGRSDQPIASVSEAQRMLFGRERARLLAWFDPARPVATGGTRGPEEEARARLGKHFFFWEKLAELAEQGMQELTRLTGRPLSFVQQHDLEDAKIVLVTQGTLVQSARAVAQHLRQVRGWKIGVLGITWLRPFPVREVARALHGRETVAVVEALGESTLAGPPLFRELAAATSGSENWLSATCAGTGAGPAALVGLCELMRQPGRPPRVHLERAATAGTAGFPRREALLQAVSNAYPALVQAALPQTEPPELGPADGRSVALVGREAELPPDALSLLARRLAAEAGPVVRGTVVRVEPDAWEARLRAAPADFPNPGPRAPVSLLLAVANDLRDLGPPPLTSEAAGSDILLVTHVPPERLWETLPAAWRRAMRDGKHRLLVVDGEFEAALDALAACLRGEQRGLLESGRVREVVWRELEIRETTDRDLPRLVSRIPQARPAHDSLPRFWGEVVQPRQEGALDELPDPLTASGVVPAGASALEPDAHSLRLPELDAGLCSGCGRCWSACPDSAIGVTATASEPLFTAASHLAGTEGEAADALRRAHKHLAGRLAAQLPKIETTALDMDVCRDAWGWVAERLNLSEEQRPVYDAAFEATLEVVEQLQPVVSNPFFREPEREQKGAGELLVLAFDPRACLGCGLCVAVCPEDALQAADRTRERVAEYNQRWRAWEALPDTSGETLARAAMHPEVGPLAAVLLSRHCGQAQVGGGGEPGSGERLASRLVAGLVEHHAQRRMAGLLKRVEEQRANLEKKARERLAEGLSEADLATLQEALSGRGRARGDLSELGERLEALGSRASFDRRSVLRMTRVAGVLDEYRERLSAGPDGLGRARFGVVIAQGSVAEWAARFPRHPFYAPLTLAPTTQCVELARGIARGLMAEHLALIRTLRRAALEVDSPPDRSARLAEIESIGWDDLDPEERAACPPLLLLGDDSALLAQGLDALGRLLDSELPVKVIVLDGRGRLASGPEPALVAMAHRRAFVLSSSSAHPEHLSRGLADALAWPGAALVHLHAPSPQRHGFPSDATLERARLAVESRAHILLRYDPQAEGLFGLRASLEGNPCLDQDWGAASFAEWAAGEARFARHFETLDADVGLPLSEWLALPEGGRKTQLPFVEIDERRLALSQRMAQACNERLAVWNTLRELTGGASPFVERIRASLSAELQAERETEIAALKAEYETRISETAAGADRQALDRLTDRLLVLSGFDPASSAKGNEG